MPSETTPRRELRFAGAATIRGLRPINGQLLVRIEPTEPRSDLLIALPTGSGVDPRQPRRGTVVARGARDANGAASQVDVGDLVLFPASCGHGLRLRINGHEHVLVRERDVLAVVDMDA
jgi:co-chaperonin GroES (HSP10)